MTQKKKQQNQSQTSEITSQNTTKQPVNMVEKKKRRMNGINYLQGHTTINVPETLQLNNNELTI